MSDKKGLSDIDQLIAEFEASDLRELHARHWDFEVYLSKDRDAAGLDAVYAPEDRGPAQKPPAPAVTTATAPPEEAVPETEWPADAIVVRAPYLGTFYRAPKPGAPVYVEIGNSVDETTELCLVEVMKLFTAVRAGVSGKIAAVLAKDGEMVSADQPIFLIEPD